MSIVAIDTSRLNGVIERLIRDSTEHGAQIQQLQHDVSQLKLSINAAVETTVCQVTSALQALRDDFGRRHTDLTDHVERMSLDRVLRLERDLMEISAVANKAHNAAERQQEWNATRLADLTLLHSKINDVTFNATAPNIQPAALSSVGGRIETTSTSNIPAPATSDMLLNDVHERLLDVYALLELRPQAVRDAVRGTPNDRMRIVLSVPAVAMLAEDIRQLRADMAFRTAQANAQTVGKPNAYTPSRSALTRNLIERYGRDTPPSPTAPVSANALLLTNAASPVPLDQRRLATDSSPSVELKHTSVIRPQGATVVVDAVVRHNESSTSAIAADVRGHREFTNATAGSSMGLER